MAEQLWFAIRVPPQKEFIAKKILGDNGVTVFLPTEYRNARTNRFSKQREPYPRPLLIGYLFIAFEGFPQWHLLFRFPRLVQYVVGIKGQPIQISSDFIDYFRRVSIRSEDEAKSPRVEHHPFKSGDKAKLRIGPFNEFVARVERVLGTQACVRLRMFGSTRSITVAIDRLEVL